MKKYLGIDVHTNSSTWCLIGENGEVLDEGKVPTTVPDLQELVKELTKDGELVVGQEVGGMAYFVRDAMTAPGVQVLSFNAQHLRVIAASRKKTDRRDAYWIAKTLQTGMTPHPVYLPTGEVRELRELLKRRRTVQRDRNRWQYRARAYFRANGFKIRTGGHYLRKAMDKLVQRPDGVDTIQLEGLGLCERYDTMLSEELAHIDAMLKVRTEGIDAIERLMTIPGVGHLIATSIYAWVGDIGRFPNAKSLAAYAGVVPTVRQSGDVNRSGGITKEGAKSLRATIVQGAHIIMNQCRSDEAKPLQAIGERIRGSRGRKKIATVALARHTLRIAYYILRDGTVYDPKRIRFGRSEQAV